MKALKVVMLLLLMALGSLRAQDESLVCESASMSVTATDWEYPTPVFGQPYRGGIYATTTGVIRVLVVFVRFKDDWEDAPDWHLDIGNPSTGDALPDWAQTIVDPDIPNSHFTYDNLSDYFSLASGGKRAYMQGTQYMVDEIGQFKMIGDVKYVVTSLNESDYKDDPSKNPANPTDPNWHPLNRVEKVNLEVLNALNATSSSQVKYGGANVNFANYDNWTFNVKNASRKYQYFTHSNTSDGKVDHIFLVFRNRPMPSGVSYGGYSIIDGSSHFTADGKTIDGSTTFYGMRGRIKVRGNLAHEYFHNCFAGDHWDSHMIWYGENHGNLRMFNLMCIADCGYIGTYERYLMGWLNPTIVTSTTSLTLHDSNLRNGAVMIPLTYDANGWPKDFYWLENYESRNEYSGANPFMTTEIFGNQLMHGLLVYQVRKADFKTVFNSEINILCADGNYDWNLVNGTVDWFTGLLLNKVRPNIAGYDERGAILAEYNAKMYGPYKTLVPDTDEPTWRYTANKWLGEQVDLFKEGYADVFDRYSNPAAYHADGVTPTNVGFQIVSWNPSTKAYTLNIQTTLAGVNTLRPAKPENLKVSFTGYYENATLSWQSHYASGEPCTGYNIYRRIVDPVQPDDYRVVATVGQGVTSYTDTQVLRGGPFGADYKVTTLNGAQESLPSNTVSVSGIDYMPKKAADNTEIKITSNKLLQNYPNPFNPTTNIYYTVKENNMVKLQVFDILGNRVAELVNEIKPEGEYTASFDGRGLPSGIYIYKLLCGNYSAARKMLLTK